MADLGVKIIPQFFRVAPQFGVLTKNNLFFVGRDYTTFKMSYAKVATLKIKTCNGHVNINLMTSTSKK